MLSSLEMLQSTNLLHSVRCGHCGGACVGDSACGRSRCAKDCQIEWILHLFTSPSLSFGRLCFSIVWIIINHIIY